MSLILALAIDLACLAVNLLALYTYLRIAFALIRKRDADMETRIERAVEPLAIIDPTKNRGWRLIVTLFALALSLPPVGLTVIGFALATTAPNNTQAIAYAAVGLIAGAWTIAAFGLFAIYAIYCRQIKHRKAPVIAGRRRS